MRESAVNVVQEHLPFFITGPGESDILFTAVTIALILIVIGFGALYFTIQAIPDRLVEGTSKAQMQLVGILGLISLTSFCRPNGPALRQRLPRRSLKLTNPRCMLG